MGLVTDVSLSLASDGAFTTGDPVGDATSYALAVFIAAAAWRLFKWYRKEQRDLDVDHDAEVAKHRHNVNVLLAHCTALSVELARNGIDVPPMPQLEE